MEISFDAIYEDGILRPLTPLALPNHARVAITVNATSLQSSDDACLRQQMALDAMFKEVDALAQHDLKDGLSGRDHDQILYGTSK